MTNYNDGNWHGWNGEECPVHPESYVQGLYLRDGKPTHDSPVTDYASQFDWKRDHANTLVAFRVLKEHREPREWWAFGAHLRDTLADAETFRAEVHRANPDMGFMITPIIHVREVLE